MSAKTPLLELTKRVTGVIETVKGAGLASGAGGGCLPEDDGGG